MTGLEMSSADEISPRERNARQSLPEIARASERAYGRSSFDTSFYNLEEYDLEAGDSRREGTRRTKGMTESSLSLSFSLYRICRLV